MVRLTRLTIALATAVFVGWALFLASAALAGPGGAFCLDAAGTKPPDSGCVHVSVDPITGRGMSNHETSRTDAAGVTTWYHAGTPVTGPIALPLFLTVPILTAAIYLAVEAIERRAEEEEQRAGGAGVRTEPRRP